MSKNKTMLLVAWTNFFIGISFYFFQYALRTSISTLSPEIETTLAITPAKLANIAAVYFYIFIVVQFFSGILVDEFGVRKIFIFSSIVCGIGSFIFGFAHNGLLLYAGRICMGAGSACSLIVALTIIKKQFSEDLVPLLMGVTATIGILGAIVGEEIILLLPEALNWRYIFFTGGIVCFILSIKVIFFISLQASHGTLSKGEQIKKFAVIPALCAISRNKILLMAFVIAGVLNICIDLIASLWGIPYLIHRYHYSIELSAMINSMVFVGYAIGSIVLPLSIRKLRADLVLMCACFMNLFFFVLFLFSPANIFIHLVVSLGLGFSAGGITVVLVMVGLLASKQVLGTVFSITEVSRHLVSVVLIQVFGYMLENVHVQGVGAYTMPILLVIGLTIIACIFSILIFRKNVLADLSSAH